MIKYEPVAKRGVNLFFCIAQLVRIDTMYSFSLNYFSNLFKNVISKCKAEENRIEVLKTEITEDVFQKISRGLFNSHKLIFSFLLAVSIEMQERDQLT